MRFLKMTMKKETQAQKFDFIVLGGGVSGLGFAKRISENGRSVLVLEKESVVGGLSRTLNHNNFYLDFCAHRFHTNNKALLNEIQSLPGLTMRRHIKKSRIYIFHKYLKYPFELQNLLRAMPLYQSFLCGCSFIYNQFAKHFYKKSGLKSYKDWFVYQYGKRLYSVMCYPYTSKIWHVDPAEISADWADQRFQGENMKKLLRRIILKLFRLDFSSYSLEDDSLAPDGGPFYYPLRGIQEMPDALARAAQTNGTKIRTSVEIISINSAKKTVSYQEENKIKTVNYGDLISTIPLHSLYALQERKEAVVEKALKDTKYMSIIFVYLFINKPQVSNDHWIYFPDKDIVFNRAVEFGNWSPEMCPPGKTSICFDITTFEDTPEWSMPDSALTERVISDAVRIKYLERTDIESSYVLKIRYAYPFYDLAYKKRLDVIVNFFENNKSTHLLGRTGIFKYNNSDNSIEMGFALAEKFLQGKKNKSIYDYEVKSISY